jgi:ABC-type sugar transport system substrate-binding protein
MDDAGAIELSKIKANLSGLHIVGNDLSNRGVKYLMRGVMTNATSLSIDMN